MTKVNTVNTPNTAPEGNPLALVAGGVAIGVVVGMLLPRIDKERELLAPVGAKIADRAHATIEAAKEAGRAEIEGLIPNRDMAKDKVGSLFGNILGAAAKGSAAQRA
jgi:hypothetical protein